MTTPHTDNQPAAQRFDLSLTGPNLDSPRPLIGPMVGPMVGPDSGAMNRSTSADDLMDRARAAAQREDDENREGVALGKRLIIAFVMMVALSIAFIVLVAELNVYVPPIVFLLSFIAIAVGTTLTVMPTGESKQSAGKSQSSCGCAPDDEGRPIGCCQGPRPMRMFRDR